MTLKETQCYGKNFRPPGLAELILWKWLYHQIQPRDSITHQNSDGILHRSRKPNPRVRVGPQKATGNQEIAFLFAFIGRFFLKLSSFFGRNYTTASSQFCVTYLKNLIWLESSSRAGCLDCGKHDSESGLALWRSHVPSAPFWASCFTSLTHDFLPC